MKAKVSLHKRQFVLYWKIYLCKYEYNIFIEDGLERDSRVFMLNVSNSVFVPVEVLIMF